ncbi:MurR/RpiR family transcriptional regulator [Catenibacterium mitsuokai]|uniref:MurR/RpiR family transcriptional regulator n=1 Tax=Catenibacterium mitsuokai TaxID=100886 RepID=UPI0018A9F16B|nr:MurR/RpiR family transcriptional regulator [Catenibacterium mitsuokai]
MILDISQENKYTETEKEVIDYLMNHLDLLEELSINDLAKKTYTSNATIIRLCRKAGYSGYKALKVDLIKEREANKYIVESVDYTTPFQFNETTEEIMKNMFSLYQESIKQVYSSLNIDVLKSMANEIIHKKRIFLFSYGDTQTTVINFTNKLVKVNIFPTLATQFGEERHISKRMNKDDYALIISYRGQERLLECVQTLSKNHVRIGLITANKKNSLMAYCDDLIMIPDCEKENRISTFYSQLAFQYVLSNLYAIIYHQVND